MKKNTKLIIAAVSCVAVLSVGLAVVLNLPSETEEVTEVSTGETILLFNKTDLDVEEITVKNESGEYQLMGYSYAENLTDTSTVKSSSDSSSESSSESSGEASAAEQSDIEMIYTMQGHETETLEKSLTDILVSECNYMAATQIVDKTGKKYAEYGLDDPKATAEIVFSDNTTVKMYIGNDAPDDKGVYLRIDGDKYVYLVQKSMVDMFSYEWLQLFERQISGTFNTDDTISKVNVSGEHFDAPISITDVLNIVNYSKYTMTKPQREMCNNIEVENYGESFYGISGTEVAAIEVKSEELSKYGLDHPYIDAEISATDKSTANVVVSKADADGNVYIMKKGATIVYQMNKSDLSWYDTKYSDLLDDSIIKPYPQTLESTDISYNGKSYHYDYHRETVVNAKYEEVTTTTATYNGSDINYANLSAFVNNVAGIRRSLSSPKSLDGCTEVFSIKYSFKDINGDTDTNTLKLYRTSDNQYVAVLQDHIEGYTNSNYIQELLKQVELIPTSRQVNSITIEEETSAEESEAS